MKFLISPPMRMGNKLTGAAKRTLDFYSLFEEAERILLVDGPSFKTRDEKLDDAIEQFRIINSYSGKNPLLQLTGFLKSLFGSSKVDFILCYSEYYHSVVYSYFLAKLSRKPLIITWHHGETETYFSNGPIFFKKAMISAFAILVISDQAIEPLKTLCTQSIVQKVSPGINISKYHENSEKTYDAVFAGVNSERKGVNFIDSIWNVVNSEVPNARLCVIGNGFQSNMQYFENRNIEVLGFVEEKKKISIFSQSKVLISLSTDEGFPLVIMEAMASHLPVVTWDLPWSSPVDGVGIRVRYPDLEEFAINVVEIIKNNAKRQTLADKSYEFVGEKFSIDKAAVEEFELLKSLFE